MLVYGGSSAIIPHFDVLCSRLLHSLLFLAHHRHLQKMQNDSAQPSFRLASINLISALQSFIIIAFFIWTTFCCRSAFPPFPH